VGQEESYGCLKMALLNFLEDGARDVREILAFKIKFYDNSTSKPTSTACSLRFRRARRDKKRLQKPH